MEELVKAGEWVEWTPDVLDGMYLVYGRITHSSTPSYFIAVNKPYPEGHKYHDVPNFIYNYFEMVEYDEEPRAAFDIIKVFELK